jgi:hypothetical protein
VDGQREASALFQLDALLQRLADPTAGVEDLAGVVVGDRVGAAVAIG